MKKKEILENIKDLESENKSLKTDRIFLYIFMLLTIPIVFIAIKTNTLNEPLILFMLLFMVLLRENENIMDKNKWAIETLNKIIGVEVTETQSGENDENTNN